MLIEQQPAYVLHARPYRETSLLLECLTLDHGRLGVVARGVRGARAGAQRAALEPFQRLSMDLQRRGELATLRSAEPLDRPVRIQGDIALVGLYLNELVIRLCPRDDPQPGLFGAYRQTLHRLAAAEPAGWTLRRFERDLLAELGYALQLECRADDGEPLDPEGWYRYQPEEGLWPSAAKLPQAVQGADLLALAADISPGADGLLRLRRMMREIIRAQLGGGELHAWQVLAAAWRLG
ncbi:DNA repair protein RecO [Frateuria aurantia]